MEVSIFSYNANKRYSNARARVLLSTLSEDDGFLPEQLSSGARSPEPISQTIRCAISSKDAAKFRSNPCGKEKKASWNWLIWFILLFVRTNVFVPPIYMYILKCIGARCTEPNRPFDVVWMAEERFEARATCGLLFVIPYVTFLPCHCGLERRKWCTCARF